MKFFKDTDGLSLFEKIIANTGLLIALLVIFRLVITFIVGYPFTSFAPSGPGLTESALLIVAAASLYQSYVRKAEIKKLKRWVENNYQSIEIKK